MVTQGAFGDGWRLDWPNTQDWIGAPSGGRLVVFQSAYDVMVGVLALAGAAWLVHRWRRAAPAR
jgi:hypothetical protein